MLFLFTCYLYEQKKAKRFNDKSKLFLLLNLTAFEWSYYHKKHSCLYFYFYATEPVLSFANGLIFFLLLFFLPIFALTYPFALYIIYNKDNVYRESVITFKTDYALFDLNGHILNPESVFIEGSWSNNRIADSLPIDYELPQN